MRRDLITRTISGTEVTAKVVNPSTDEISEKVVVLGKAVEDADKVKKLVVKELDPETEVLIHIKEFHKVDKLYGMTITDFMAAAGELDPATRDFMAAAGELDPATRDFIKADEEE